MFPFSGCWKTELLLLLLLALAVRESWQTEENSCDLVGEKDKESKNEVALLERLRPLFNKSFESTVGQCSDTYSYISNHSSGANLVQINKSHEETVVGRINKTRIFNGSNWIMLIYKGGDEYDNHCVKEQHRAVVMISCNRHTPAGNFNPVSEERGKVQDCFYLFEMDSSLACSPEGSHLSFELNLTCHICIVGCSLYHWGFFGLVWFWGFFFFFGFQDRVSLYSPGCPGTHSLDQAGFELRNLPAFASQVLGLKACAPLLGFIGIFLYQRLVVGAKGMEQFPHLAFWQDLGKLVADGCDFVCCSKPCNVPEAYRGVGDDQLGEESEERDDHLLPM